MLLPQAWNPDGYLEKMGVWALLPGMPWADHDQSETIEGSEETKEGSEVLSLPTCTEPACEGWVVENLI